MSEKKMLPEVAEYLADIKAANKLYDTVTGALDAATRGRSAFGSSTGKERDLYNEYHTGVQAAQRERETSRRDAWDELKDSADPLVSWIAHNADSYLSQAVTVLRALPATVEELDDVATDAGWCDEWFRFRVKAQQDGVLPGLKPRPAGAYELLEWIWERGGEEFDAQELEQFDAMIDGLIEETKNEVRKDATPTEG